MLSTLVISGLIARSLGVENYGVFQFALSFVLIFMPLSYICGSEIVVPKLIKMSSERIQHQLLCHVFILRLGASVLAYTILLLIAAYISESNNQFLIICLLGLMLLFTEPFAITTAWLQARTFSKPKVLLAMLALMVKVVLVGLLYLLSIHDVIKYAAAWMSEFVVLALGLSWYYYRHIYQHSNFSIDGKLLRVLFHSGLPFLFALLVMQIFLRLDMLVLKWLADDFSLGIYASAMQLNLAFAAVAPLLANTFAPRLVFALTNELQVKKNILIVSGLMFIFALLCVPIISYFSEQVVHLVFGSQFSASAEVLIYLLPGCCLYYGDCGLNLLFIRSRKGGRLIVKWLAVLSVAFVSYVVLIPKYGVIGAAIGYDLAMLAAVIISILSFYTQFLLRKN